MESQWRSWNWSLLTFLSFALIKAKNRRKKSFDCRSRSSGNNNSNIISNSGKNFWQNYVLERLNFGPHTLIQSRKAIHTHLHTNTLTLSQTNTPTHTYTRTNTHSHSPIHSRTRTQLSLIDPSKSLASFLLVNSKIFSFEVEREAAFCRKSISRERSFRHQKFNLEMRKTSEATGSKSVNLLWKEL